MPNLPTSQPPPVHDAYTDLWPSNLPVNKPGEGFLPNEYQMFKAWDRYDYETKRFRARQANRVHVYASQMMGAVRV